MPNHEVLYELESHAYPVFLIYSITAWHELHGL